MKLLQNWYLHFSLADKELDIIEMAVYGDVIRPGNQCRCRTVAEMLGQVKLRDKLAPCELPHKEPSWQNLVGPYLPVVSSNPATLLGSAQLLFSTDYCTIQQMIIQDTIFFKHSIILVKCTNTILSNALCNY